MIAVPAEDEAMVETSEVSACAPRMILKEFAATVEKVPEPEA